MDKKILGSPTKELFVHILTRDLSLEDAINDLVDNCIDGAKRLRKSGDYRGLWISIRIQDNLFSIEDNCGGIELEVARKYAFRFGRPGEMPNTDFSIGQFGVGMKRAIFKLGSAFYIESRHKKSEFQIVIDINQWLLKMKEDGSEDWNFHFQDFTENIAIPTEKTGTYIEVTPLHSEIGDFINTNDYFISGLKSKVELTHMENIHKGIEIFINEDLLTPRRPKFIVSNVLKVAEYNHTFDNNVSLRILTGIGQDVEEEGGWYIFCNDRLLLGPHQEELTGWTGKGKGGVAKYHQQFWRFRGLVFFKSEDAKELPWNTSKNDVDASSPEFLFARQKMIDQMKPVIRLLNSMKKERETFPDGSIPEERPLENIVASGKSVDYSDLKRPMLSDTFVIPQVKKTEKKSSTVRISYLKEKSVVDRVAEYLKVKKPKTVGEKTFDYYLKMEDLDDE